MGGTVKNFENFTFMRVFDAGHMVPTDQPQYAYDMIYEFMRTKKITACKDKADCSSTADRSTEDIIVIQE